MELDAFVVDTGLSAVAFGCLGALFLFAVIGNAGVLGRAVRLSDASNWVASVVAAYMWIFTCFVAVGGGNTVDHFAFVLRAKKG